MTSPQITAPQIIAVVNQKGGVGKTTTAVNLATAVTAVGKRTLVIDLDPQGNASTGFGVPAKERKVTSYDLLIDSALTLKDVAVATTVPGLWLVPSEVDLAAIDVELANSSSREFILKNKLAAVAGE